MIAQRSQLPLEGGDDGKVVHLVVTEVFPEAHEIPEQNTGLASFSLTDFLNEGDTAPSFVAGLFPRGDVTVLAARSGLGKSFLTLQAAICVAAGRPFLGQPVEPGVAIALFYEDPAHVLRGRIICLLEALGLTADDLEGKLRLKSFDPYSPESHVLWRDGALTDAFYQLDDNIGQLGGVHLLVIDTAKLVFRDAIVDTEAVRFFISALRSLAARRDVAIVLVTHVNRAGDTSGTTEWENHARALVHVKATADHFRLEVVKTNYAAPIPPLPIARNGNGTWALHAEAGPAPTGPGARPKPKPPAERARQVFLEGLDAIAEPLSTHKNSPKGNFAPKRIAKLPRSRQLRVAQPALEVAMSELLAEGVIMEVPGPGKHKTMILARAKGEV